MKSLFLLGLGLSVLTLSGCVSTATRQAFDKVKNSDRAYGQVVEVKEANTSAIRNSLCKSPAEPSTKEICQHLDQYNVVKLVVMRVNRFITSQILVPKSEQAGENNFIEYSPAEKVLSFRRVVTRTATDTCKWEGPVTYQFANSGTGAAVGFAAGMLVAPTAVITSDALAGGVICEGWSYKSLITS